MRLEHVELESRRVMDAMGRMEERLWRGRARGRQELEAHRSPQSPVRTLTARPDHDEPTTGGTAS